MIEQAFETPFEAPLQAPFEEEEEEVFEDPASSGHRSASWMDVVVERSELLAGVRLGRLSAVAELDRRGDYVREGYVSTSAFLMHGCGMGAGEAKREVFLARSLGEMGYAVKSAYAGRISVGQLEVLAYARSRHPEAFSGDEAALVEAVSGLTLAESRRVADHWVHLHDEWEGDPAGEGEEPSRVWLSRTWRGRWRLDGDLSPEVGSLLDSALDSLVSEIVRHSPAGESPPAPERRGEALGEMARRFLDSEEVPTDHGNRPHLTVVIDWETLTGHRTEIGGVSELLDGTSIRPVDACRLACDARVCRLLTGPEGEILDLGRSRRTVTPAQWRALRVRDRHCQFRGCRRPWRWCDAHHLEFWAHHDGPTDLARLVLLCRHHHT
ncbi:MAG: DUF222 domain-containing protein, partial [Actinomycetota bacterium]